MKTLPLVQTLCAGGSVLASVAAPMLLSADAPALPPRPGADRPNFIYILADDAGYGDFGCYGQQKFQTPAIDRLAEAGIRFTQHYAGAPVCAPSRCCLLTGLHTGHTYIRGNKEIFPEGQEPLPEATVTLPKLLKTVGYATGAIGKWGLGYPGSSGAPEKQGFDSFFGYNCQRAAHNYYPPSLWENGQSISLPPKTYSHDLFVQHAKAFIQAHAAEPFFLFLPFTLPHAQLQVPDTGSYADRPWSPLQKNFAAMMERLDQAVGEITDTVDRLGLAEKTLIFFASDNGPHAEGGATPRFFNSSGGLKGIKREVTEGGIRVPFIVRWKGHIRPGQVSSHLSAFWDLLPTVAQLAGAPIPADTDGISFVPTLTGEGEQPQHPFLYWEFHEQGGRQAVRAGEWKAIRLRAFANPNRPVRLYNLTTDPGETVNVAAAHPEIAKRLTQMMSAAHSPNALFGGLDSPSLFPASHDPSNR